MQDIQYYLEQQYMIHFNIQMKMELFNFLMQNKNKYKEAMHCVVLDMTTHNNNLQLETLGELTGE